MTKVLQKVKTTVILEQLRCPKLHRSQSVQGVWSD